MNKQATKKSTVKKIEDLAVKDGSNVNGGLSLNFSKIEYKYTPFDDKHKAGTPVPVTYDLTTGTK